MDDNRDYLVKIKPLKQPDPMACSITCLRMILDYYGCEVSQDEVYKFIVRATPEGGSFLSEIGRFANKVGFQVDLLAYNSYLTDPKDALLPQDRLLKKLEKILAKSNRDKYYDLMLESTVKAIKEGVNYIIRKPNFEMIKSYLSKKVPISVRVNYATLHDEQGDPFESHDIVICGIKNSLVYYIDPEHAKMASMKNDDLMFAIVSSKVISASAYLLAIKR